MPLSQHEFLQGQYPLLPQQSGRDLKDMQRHVESNLDDRKFRQLGVPQFLFRFWRVCMRLRSFDLNTPVQVLAAVVPNQNLT